MRRTILGCTLLLVVFAAVPAFAQDCSSVQCYVPPPYTTATCDTYRYNGPTCCCPIGSTCILEGYCVTAGGDECPHEPACVQNWVRFQNPRPLKEEWALVRATIRPQNGRRS